MKTSVRATLEGKFVRHAEGKDYPVPEKEFVDDATHLLLGTNTDPFKCVDQELCISSTIQIFLLFRNIYDSAITFTFSFLLFREIYFLNAQGVELFLEQNVITSFIVILALASKHVIVNCARN